MELILHLTIKLILGFITLFFMTKLIGGREVKQLTVFDFISAIVLSELIGNSLFSDKANALQMIYAIVFWTLLIILVDKITMKSFPARKFLDGEPQVIIEQGKIDKSILKKNNMDINELFSLLRQKDVFSIRDVKLAFIEPNGSISTLKTSAPSKNKLAVPVIIDGHIIQPALQKIGKDKAWMEKEIGSHGFQHAGQILLAEYMDGEELHIQKESQKKNGKQNSK